MRLRAVTAAPGLRQQHDEFYFVHRPLTGNGSITVRVTSLTGSELQPWSKAGIIIKQSTQPGSAYAAMMVTGGHGVRMLIALLGLGAATAVRDSATAIGIVLGLLYLFPIVANVVGDAQWQRHLQQIGPMTAGLAIQATTDPGHEPIGPWAGLGVLAAWAAAALLAGGLLLRLRDA